MEAEGSNGVPLLSRPAVKVGAALVVLAILAVAALRAVAPDNGTDAVLSSAPGFDGGERPADTSPFQMAEPDREGPTTIPDGLLPTSTTIPPTTAPPTTLPPLVQVPADDSVCLAAQQIADLYRVSGPLERTPAELAATATDRLEAAIRYLRQADPGQYAQALGLFERAVEKLRTTTSVDGVIAVVSPIGTLSTLEAQSALAPVFAHIQQSCPQLAAG